MIRRCLESPPSFSVAVATRRSARRRLHRDHLFPTGMRRRILRQKRLCSIKSADAQPLCATSVVFTGRILFAWAIPFLAHAFDRHAWTRYARRSSELSGASVPKAQLLHSEFELYQLDDDLMWYSLCISVLSRIGNTCHLNPRGRVTPF